MHSNEIEAELVCLLEPCLDVEVHSDSSTRQGGESDSVGKVVAWAADFEADYTEGIAGVGNVLAAV